MIPALTLIIARVMALVELVLEQFVNITPVTTNCSGEYLLANLTCEGQELAKNIADTISSVIAIIPSLLEGLSVVAKT